MTPARALQVLNSESLKILEHECGPELIEELLELFQADSPSRVARIRAAAASRNFEQVEHESHSLKSSAANLGAEQVSAICAELEKLGEHLKSTPDTTDTAGMDSWANQLADEFDVLLKQLKLQPYCQQKS